MLAFRNKTECGRAMMSWQGQPHDAVTRVANTFIAGYDADADLVRRAHSILNVTKGLDSTRVSDDERLDLERIVKYLETYIQDMKKR